MAWRSEVEQELKALKERARCATLTSLQDGNAPEWKETAVSAPDFFETVRAHTVMGFLADPRYGTPTADDPPRMALHAAVLGFVHPSTGEVVRFTSEWPADLTPWLDAMRK